MEKKILSCFKKTFKKSKLPKDISKMKLGNIKGWDSLGHVNLLLEIEKKFKIKFSMQEISELKSFNKIISKLKKIEKK
jgi:acyl carrier protein